MQRLPNEATMKNMRIYLVRHAKAVDRQNGIPEERRFLTDEGRTAFRQTARRLARKGIEPEIIFTSPLIRAVQTAEILASALRFEGPVAVTSELEPGFNKDGLVRLLTGLSATREIALVGHEPDLSVLAETLTEPREPVVLKKGDLLALDIDPDFKDPARLVWRTIKGKITKVP